MRSLLALFLLLCLPLAGCQRAQATQDPEPVLWSAESAQQALTDLRAIRQQEKLLLEIRTLATATNAGVAALTTQVEAVEQRLEHPVSPTPVFPEAVRAADIPPTADTDQTLCVTIDGIDTDLDRYIADNYEDPWTWTGEQSEQGLRLHLAEHGVTNIDNVPFPTLRKLHAALHEKEAMALSTLPAGPVNSVGFQLFGDVPPEHSPAPTPQVTPRPSPLVVNGPPAARTRTKTVTVVTPQTVSSRSVSSSNCPNGICPTPQVQSYSSQSVRSRRFFLFPRWR